MITNRVLLHSHIMVKICHQVDLPRSQCFNSQYEPCLDYHSEDGPRPRLCRDDTVGKHCMRVHNCRFIHFDHRSNDIWCLNCQAHTSHDCRAGPVSGVQLENDRGWGCWSRTDDCGFYCSVCQTTITCPKYLKEGCSQGRDCLRPHTITPDYLAILQDQNQHLPEYKACQRCRQNSWHACGICKCYRCHYNVICNYYPSADHRHQPQTDKCLECTQLKFYLRLILSCQSQEYVVYDHLWLYPQPGVEQTDSGVRLQVEYQRVEETHDGYCSDPGDIEEERTMISVDMPLLPIIRAPDLVQIEGQLQLKPRVLQACYGIQYGNGCAARRTCETQIYWRPQSSQVTVADDQPVDLRGFLLSILSEKQKDIFRAILLYWAFRKEKTPLRSLPRWLLTDILRLSSV